MGLSLNFPVYLNDTRETDRDRDRDRDRKNGDRDRETASLCHLPATLNVKK